jgi:hypothetical protein
MLTVYKSHFFFFAVLGIELRALSLLAKHFAT